MAWTAPRTWVVGEVVTASMMNTHVRDNLKALSDLSATSRLNQQQLGAWQGFGTGAGLLGNGVESYNIWGNPTSANISGAAVDFDVLAAVSATTQWRMSTRFNVTLIVPGGPSAVSWEGRVELQATRGTAAAPPPGSVTIGSASVTNATGEAAYDTGWVAVSAAGLRFYWPKWFSNRTGGSGAGNFAAEATAFLEIKNV